MTATSSDRKLPMLARACAASLLLWFAGQACAQQQDPVATPAIKTESDSIAAQVIADALMLSGLGKVTLKDFSHDAREFLDNALHSPETANKANELLLRQAPGWAFLKDINFKFKAFDTANADVDTSLGFEYSFDRSFTRGSVGCKADPCTRALDFSLHADGNVAFDEDVNPNNFLDTRLSFSFFQSTGGVRALAPEQQKQYSDLVFEAGQLKRAADPAKFDAKVDEMLDIAASRLTTQFYFESAFDAHLESNQSFTEKQFVYAVRLAGEIKPWGSIWTNNFDALDNWSKFNLLDYPFAALRLLTGYDECGCFLPRGVSLPTVSVAIGTVDPQDEDPRTVIAGPGSYTRFNAEVSFKTPVAHLNGDVVSIAMNYRLYDELDAEAAVSAAGLNRFEYFVATLGTQNGPFISYSSGKLPFDAQSDVVYAIGFQTHLD